MASAIRPLVAGNWKMNGTSEDLATLLAIANGFMSGLETETDAVICLPSTLLSRASDTIGHGRTPVGLGGQNCHAAPTGAHTGDVSAEMLKDAGASHVIVGHSERRTDHGETDAIVLAKAEAAWRAGLVAIVCIGETKDERTSEETLAVLSKQIAGSVPAEAKPATTVVAYEPVWAIGTGLTPSAADVADAHEHIRKELVARLGEGAQDMRILYGGSVKPSNATELLAIADVNGALVGGASLKAADFLGIAEAYTRVR